MAYTGHREHPVEEGLALGYSNICKCGSPGGDMELRLSGRERLIEGAFNHEAVFVGRGDCPAQRYRTAFVDGSRKVGRG